MKRPSCDDEVEVDADMGVEEDEDVVALEEAEDALVVAGFAEAEDSVVSAVADLVDLADSAAGDPDGTMTAVEMTVEIVSLFEFKIEHR
ncbi:hypothetical protein K7432_015275 [Basidiobolus ranarum]|uniref:Uncharacterized protein n=1 Tax=Basidiobolus ranarum TaxID=34480 RepID=A0ABR2VPC1_9FUNG